MTSSVASAANRWLLGLVILLVALNLRPALTSVGPILIEIKQGLPSVGAHVVWLSFLPVLAMGAGGPIATKMAARLGAERSILLAVILMVVSMAARAIPHEIPLFFGTILAGLGIGVTGVLLPSIVKRDFRDHPELMMGLFTMALCFGAALAAGLSKPIEVWLDSWALALAFWAIPALLAVLVWWPVAQTKSVRHSGALVKVPLLRNALAWKVTLFMGLQSALAYTVFAWAAPILRERGIDAVTAGLVVSVSIIIQIPISVLVPIIAKKIPARPTVLAIVGLGALGLAGLIYLPLSGMWFWAVLLGLGHGGSFAIALTLLLRRAATAPVAGRLSAMAQGFGYAMAALCPLVVGWLREVFGAWSTAGGMLMIIALLAALFGYLSAAPQQIQEDGTII